MMPHLMVANPQKAKCGTVSGFPDRLIFLNAWIDFGRFGWRFRWR